MSSTNTRTDLKHLTAALNERCELWQSHLRSTASIDRNAVELALKQVYELVGKPAPAVVWGESPWQVVAMAAVLEKQTPRNAIKKWNQHPPQLRLSENRFEELWDRLWRQLDAQLDEERRKKLILPDAQSEKNSNESWQKSWLSKIPFTSNPIPKTIWGTHTLVQTAWTTLGKEMRAPCAIRYENDPQYAALQAHFTEKMGARTEETLSRLLQNDFNAFNTAGFNLTLFERFTAENLTHLGIEALKGNLQEEFDNLCTPDERKSFEFAISLMAVTFAVFSTRQYNASLGMVPFYDFLCDEMPDLPIGPSNRKKAKIFLNLARQTPLALLLDHVAFVSERPLVMQLDENGRLHSADGPALAYSDGYKLYSWHGTTVRQALIDNPSSITVQNILKEWNAEVRRVMIDRYGASQFLLDAGATEVQRDECGVLYRKELTNDEALVMVKVVNSTPEPDGTYKNYFLRVPPTIQTAREAVAWTFDMDPAGYSPERQT